MHDFRQPLPWRTSAATYYAECLELIEAAERLGYETVWLAEHHGTCDGVVSSPLVLAAAIAARTRRIKVGTNVMLLPLHHPIRVAEDGAAVHAVSGGRLILGVGQGYAPHEFALFGVERSHRPSQFEEGIDVIRRAWRDGRTGFAADVVGVHGKLRNPRSDEGVDEPAVRQRDVDAAAAVKVDTALTPDHSDGRDRVPRQEDVLVSLMPGEERLRGGVLTAVLMDRADVMPPRLDAGREALDRPHPGLRLRLAARPERRTAGVVHRRALGIRASDPSRPCRSLPLSALAWNPLCSCRYCESSMTIGVRSQMAFVSRNRWACATTSPPIMPIQRQSGPPTRLVTALLRSQISSRRS